MTNPFDCVVDASVGIKFFLKEEHSDHVDALFSHLSDKPPARFYVPDFFYIECANILWKHVQRYNYPTDIAKQNIADLIALPLRSIPMEALTEDALVLAAKYNHPAYDAAYVTLATRLALPLVTADKRLIHTFSKENFDVRFIGDWPSP